MFQEVAKEHNVIRDDLKEKYFKFKKEVPEKMNIIKRGFLLFIAIRMLNTQKLDEITELFRMLDKDIDGYLSFSDIAVGNKGEYYEDL